VCFDRLVSTPVDVSPLSRRRNEFILSLRRSRSRLDADSPGWPVISNLLTNSAKYTGGRQVGWRRTARW